MRVVCADMGVMRQMSGPMGVTTAAGYPVTTSVIRQLANKSLSPDMTVRTNPLDAFDTADVSNSINLVLFNFI